MMSPSVGQPAAGPAAPRGPAHSSSSPSRARGVRGDHGGPPALAQHAGTDLLRARTRAFKNSYMYACMDTHRPAALMLPLSQDAFIEKTLPQELLILSLPHLVLQQELSSTWKEKS